MKKFTKNLSVLLILFFLTAGFQSAKACHGLALLNMTATVSATDVTINANSDPASCGCGPYLMQAEIIPASMLFSGAPPVWTSTAWGTIPWMETYLNVPGYGPPSWADNCVIEPYTAMVIPFSGLCPGVSYKIRLREYVAASASAGPWTIPYTFTTPGITPAVTVTASALSSAMCFGDSTQVSASGAGCSGSYSYSWSPTTGLSNPLAATTAATPSVTTTYTVTYTDSTLASTATATVTIIVNGNPSGSLTSVIESTCNGTNGSATVAGSGGAPPYSYLWNTTPPTTTAMATGLASGNYTVTITDTNGCVVLLPVVEGDSCDFVWPGDANDDAVANNFDILDIGIATGATGTTRASASLSWYGQPSAPWGTTLLSGTDYKWVDCNGDGAINASDTTAVILNYGFTHNNRYGTPEHVAAAPDLSLVLAPDSLIPNSPGLIYVELGSSALQASNIYGVAFSINFDPAQIDPQSIGFSLAGSWLGTAGVDLMGIKYTMVGNGRVDVAITRLDQTNRSGFGQIGTMYYNTTNMMTGTGSSALIPFSITAVRVISANENPVAVNTVNDTLTVFDPVVTGIANEGLLNFSISPNPNNGQFSISFYSPQAQNYSIQIVNMLGQQIDVAEVKNVEGNFRKDILLPEGEGIYFVRIISGEGKSSTAKVLVK